MSTSMSWSVTYWATARAVAWSRLDSVVAIVKWVASTSPVVEHPVSTKAALAQAARKSCRKLSTLVTDPVGWWCRATRPFPVLRCPTPSPCDPWLSYDYATVLSGTIPHPSTSRRPLDGAFRRRRQRYRAGAKFVVAGTFQGRVYRPGPRVWMPIRSWLTLRYSRFLPTLHAHRQLLAVRCIRYHHREESRKSSLSSPIDSVKLHLVS